MEAEARLVRRLDVAVFVGGGRKDGALAAAATAVRAGARALISFGLAGGLDPALRPGTMTIPRAVLWRGHPYPACPDLSSALGGITADSLLAADGVVANAAEKAAMFHQTGAAAVDLESGAVAAAAEAAHLPFAVLRAICDPADRTLPPAALAALDAAGAIGVGRVFASVARRPGQLGGLLRLGRDAALARRALVERVDNLRRDDSLRRWALHPQPPRT